MNVSGRMLARPGAIGRHIVVPFILARILAPSPVDSDELRIRILTREHPREIALSSKGAILRVRCGESGFQTSHMVLEWKGKGLLLREAAPSASGLSSASSRVFPRIQISAHTPIALSVGATTRDYGGSLECTVEEDEIAVINHVDAASYASCVTAAELGPGAPLEAVRAQHVLVRTRIAAAPRRHAGADFCDLAHCQNYQGLLPHAVFADALGDAGRALLLKDGRPADVFFHAECGGLLMDESVWNGKPGAWRTDRLGGRDLCLASPHAHWQTNLALGEILSFFKEALGEEARTVGPVAKPFETRVLVQGASRRFSMEKDRFRLLINRRLGWKTIPSNNFTLRTEGGLLCLIGGGFGHNVGLCQWGAMAQARLGRTWREIVSFYYPDRVAVEP